MLDTRFRHRQIQVLGNDMHFYTITLFVSCVFLVTLLNRDVAAQNACQANRLSRVKNGTQKIRGANLGSWFVIESFMSRNLFKAYACDSKVMDGQYLFEQCLYRNKSVVPSRVLEKHWSTFITENDFITMSKKGTNAVRLPVGWWNIYDQFGSKAKSMMNSMISSATNYTTGSLNYIDKAFTWGRRHGIGILLGLHGAPGSQSGAANSSPMFLRQKEWATNSANVDQSIRSMTLYAQRYGRNAALLGFYLLNEPDGIDVKVLKNYYTRAYQAIRPHTDGYIVINPLNGHPYQYASDPAWVVFMSPNSAFKKVVIDDHFYSCFGGPGDTKDPQTDINYVTQSLNSVITKYQQSGNRKPLMIGEWAACWHGGSQRQGDFVKSQVAVYNKASFGWFYWSWTTNPVNQKDWSMVQAFANNWFPVIDSPAC